MPATYRNLFNKYITIPTDAAAASAVNGAAEDIIIDGT